MTAASRRSAPPRPRRTTAGWIAVILFSTLAAIGLLGALAVVGGYMVLSANLRAPQAIDQLDFVEESVIYDRTGKRELGRFGELQREVVEFEELPAILIDATTAVEDKSFWTNTGFDPAAIVASGIDAIRGNPRGASTITQQLVRQRLLDQNLVRGNGRTAERKLKEIIQSIRLTQAFPGDTGKREIITAYLNQNYYGNNSYGVKAAARKYFDKDLAELTLSEVAIIAALPQSPSNYDLVRNAVEIEQDDGSIQLRVPDDTDIVRRRNLVLDLLAQPERRVLSKDEYSGAEIEAAKDEPVILASQRQDNWFAPHFVWQVQDELARQVCTEDSQTCPRLEAGGFRITTTIDLRLQDLAERWVKLAARVPKASDPALAAQRIGFDEIPPWVANLMDKDLNNGALVALDYETGELIAYVGSADYYARRGNAKFQPKFDVVANGWRQPGSAFKPFNYLTGIDDKTMTAATMFMDAATDFGNNYTPSNADGLERGPVRMRQALQFSLNIPAVKAMAVNRVEHVFDRAEDYGVRWRETTTDAGLSFALGVEEIRPIDLVTAYGTMANQGRYTGHTTILSVKDREGRDVIEPHQRPAGEQVVSAEAAAILTNVLAGNTAEDINPFWGRFAIAGPDGRRHATLKTGTNNDAKDLNAYGYIAPPTQAGREAGEYALAVGVWNGNSDNSVVSTPEAPLFSIDVSTYVWQGFLTQATEGWANNQFTAPETLEGADVDPWVGLLPAPGQEGMSELFVPGTTPQETVGRSSGMCGEEIFERVGFESRFENWLAADRDWLARAKKGPGTVGGPHDTRVSYFYNDSFTPFGASWGPLIGTASGCATPTPAPTPTCFPVPTPDPSGVVPSFVVPTPSGSAPAPVPCPTPPPTPTPPPPPSPTPPPTPTPLPSPSASLPPEPTPPPPTPTPTPTPTPVRAPGTAGEYRCMLLGEAVLAITEHGYVLGEVGTEPDGYAPAADSYVFAQAPEPGTPHPSGQPVNLGVHEPASYPFPTCPPA